MGVFVKQDDGWLNLETGAGGGSSWGDFTTSGDEQDSGTYTDTAGRDWKWAEWNVAADYSVSLTGGMYWVLCCGGGDWGHSAGSNQFQHGQPGLVNEGYWEFPSGATPITVGHKGNKQQYLTQDDLGQPSSLGGYGTQGYVTWGHAKAGRGAQANDDPTGYKSAITGTTLEYAIGNEDATLGRSAAQDRPGRGGQNANEPTDGCVIIATVTNDPSEWNPPGTLPGIGGWADVTAVTGMGTKYEYTADGMDWSAFEWTADGDAVTTAGLIETFIISAGTSWANTNSGSGGIVVDGLQVVAAGTNDVVVGSSGVDGQTSQFGSFKSRVTYPPYGGNATGAGYFTGGSDRFVGLTSSITGVAVEYGKGQEGSTTPMDTPGSAGREGDVIIRVPRASDKTGLSAGAFDTTTLRDKAKSAAKKAVKKKKK